jgi:hypothetical protein
MNVLYYPTRKRLMKYLLTYSISLLIVIASVATSLAILMWKKQIDESDVFMNYVVILVNAIQIFIFNTIYQKLSVLFNNYENHATAVDYRNNLILKQFTFRFCNTFNSMILLAFVKPYSDVFGECIVS